VLARHWPGVRRYADVRDVGAHNLEPVDVIAFGSPCQDLSVAGLRNGLGGKRSGLFFEAARIIRELRPAYAVWENVPGALSSDGGRDFGAVLDALADSGALDICWRVLDARFFGVPQRRRRVFLVASFRTGASAFQILAEPESCGGHPAQSREEGQDIAYALNAGIRGTGDGHGNAWNSNYVTNLHEADPDGVSRPLVARESGYRMDLETETFIVSAPVRASDGHHGWSGGRDDGADNLIAFDWQASSGNDESWRGKGRQHVVRSGDYAGAASATRVDAVSYSAGVRRLTPRECNRLQGFPDDWDRYGADGKEIPDSHRYRCMGNAVCVPVAEWLGHRLVAADAWPT